MKLYWGIAAFFLPFLGWFSSNDCGTINTNENWVTYNEAKQMEIDTRELPELENQDYSSFFISKKDKNYTKNSKSVYFSGIKIKSACSSSFEVLGGDYAKDERKVFYETAKISGADPASFEYVDLDYAKDQHSVYLEGKKQKQLDPNSFSRVGNSEYVKDKNGVYILFDQRNNIEEVRALGGADPNSDYQPVRVIFTDTEAFQILNGDKEEILYKVEGADPTSFEEIDHSYFKDRNHVYYFPGQIISSDPASFQILEPNDEEPISGRIFAKDKNAVYFDGVAIEGADPASFQILSKGYAKDQSAVYYSYFYEIPPWSTARLITPYNGIVKVEGADGASFELIAFLGKDESSLFHFDKKLELNEIEPYLDIDSFTYVGDSYFKDKKYVYYYYSDYYPYSQLRGVIGADPNSFYILEPINSGDPICGRDKNGYYYKGDQDFGRKEFNEKCNLK